MLKVFDDFQRNFRLMLWSFNTMSSITAYKATSYNQHRSEITCSWRQPKSRQPKSFRLELLADFRFICSKTDCSYFDWLQLRSLACPRGNQPVVHPSRLEKVVEKQNWGKWYRVIFTHFIRLKIWLPGHGGPNRFPLGNKKLTLTKYSISERSDFLTKKYLKIYS